MKQLSGLYRHQLYANKIKILASLLITGLVLTGCSCGRKFTELEHTLLQKTEELRALETHYERELKNKDDQISILKEHIILMNEQIKELNSK